jgi:hypothetical protein
MQINYFRRAITLGVLCLLCAITFGQSRTDGDKFLNALGKGAQASEVSDLKAGYSFQMANENHYLSKDGIELLLQNSMLSEIRIYKDSPVYGSFKGHLPRGLNFNLTSAEVKKLLGKPSVSYNTGYCEFEVQGQVISCWFDKDRLSQVDLGTK